MTLLLIVSILWLLNNWIFKKIYIKIDKIILQLEKYRELEMRYNAVVKNYNTVLGDGYKINIIEGKFMISTIILFYSVLTLAKQYQKILCHFKV